MNLNVGMPCNMTPSQLHTRLLLKYTTITMAYGSALMLIECVKRYRAGFGRTGSTLLLWCMLEFECVIAWCTMHHGTIAIAYSPAVQIHYNGDDGIWLCVHVD